MKKLSTLALLVCISFLQTQAQSKKIDNILKMDLRNKGYIMENDVLAGYFLFYQVDAADKANEVYTLQILDNNLNLAKSIDIRRPKRSYLVEAVFNGKAFFLMFFRKDNVDLLTYDKAGKLLGEKTFEDLPMYEVYRLKMAVEKGSSNLSIYPLDSAGFVRHTYAKNKKYGYQVEAFENNMKQKWNYLSDPNSTMQEFADVLFSSKNYVIAHVMKKKTLMTGKFDSYMLVIDAANGKKLFEKQLEETGGDLSLLNVFVDDDKKELLVSGEYFAADKQQGKDKSDGMYFLTMDLSGSKKSFKKIPWTNSELAKMKNNEDEESKNSVNTSIFFHKMIRSKDGKLFAVGEQYKQGTNVAGMLMGGASASAINTYNMVVLEFDKEYNIVNSIKAEKKKTQCPLPQGAAYYSVSMQALMAKSMGGFDYEFTTKDPARDRFYVVYKDYNRKDEEGKKADTMIGSIIYEDGKLKNDRFPLNTEGNAMWVAPAKAGFIAVTEYFKKKKFITYRLEKISY